MHKLIKIIVFQILLVSGLHPFAQSNTGETYNLVFLNVSYKMYVPHDITGIIGKMRLLVMVHGTMGDAADYLNHPIDSLDPKYNRVIVIAPQFPKTNEQYWGKYNSNYVTWLHLLIHSELPGNVLRRLRLSGMSTQKFFLFGHSQGGQYVQSYLMKYECDDIIKAAACGSGKYYNRGDMPGVSQQEYKRKLRKLIQSNVAIIIATSDAKDARCLANKRPEDLPWEHHCDIIDNYIWLRQRLALEYFRSTLGPFLGGTYLQNVFKQPPFWHPANFPHLDFSSIIAIDNINQKKIRFFWTPVDLKGGNVQQGHKAWRNYTTARKFFFYTNREIPAPGIFPFQRLEVLRTTMPVVMQFPDGFSSKDFKITYTEDHTDPTFNSREYIPGSALSVNASIHLKAAIFCRMQDLITMEYMRGPVAEVNHVYLNNSLPVPKFSLVPNATSVFKLDLDPSLNLGEDAFVWYNIDQETDPVKGNNPPDLPYVNEIRIFGRGKHTIRSRYYIKNQQTGNLEASAVTVQRILY